jgi:hypothetical protein
MANATDIPTTLLDPLAIVRQLDAAAIRERIQTLDRERDALMVLLRAAIRAERPQPLAAAKGGAGAK